MSTTDGASYTERLERFQGARWKQLLDVQAPYRWKLKQLVGSRRTVDVGCGIGRNLVNLAPGSVGVDHNEHSVAHCRSLGLEAYTVEDFRNSAHAKPDTFDALLASHLVEHLDRPTALDVLRSYLEYLRPGAAVVLITPQERGYASDATHVRFCALPECAELCTSLGLTVRAQSSFPFPRAAGKAFTYNEFVTLAHYPGP